jgi:hypothetical protein
MERGKRDRETRPAARGADGKKKRASRRKQLSAAWRGIQAPASGLHYPAARGSRCSISRASRLSLIGHGMCAMEVADSAGDPSPDRDANARLPKKRWMISRAGWAGIAVMVFGLGRAGFDLLQPLPALTDAHQVAETLISDPEFASPDNAKSFVVLRMSTREARIDDTCFCSLCPFIGNCRLFHVDRALKKGDSVTAWIANGRILQLQRSNDVLFSYADALAGRRVRLLESSLAFLFGLLVFGNFGWQPLLEPTVPRSGPTRSLVVCFWSSVVICFLALTFGEIADKTTLGIFRNLLTAILLLCVSTLLIRMHSEKDLLKHLPDKPISLGGRIALLSCALPLLVGCLGVSLCFVGDFSGLYQTVTAWLLTTELGVMCGVLFVWLIRFAGSNGWLMGPLLLVVAFGCALVSLVLARNALQILGVPVPDFMNDLSRVCF